MRRWLILMWTVLVAAGAGSGVALASAYHGGKPTVTDGLAYRSRARPNPSTAGAPVNVAGRLSASNPAGAPVVLWERLAGTTTSRRVATTTTGPSGRYRFVRMADTERSWYATSRGLRSKIVTEQVHAKVSLASSDQYPVPGDRVRLMGQVVPSHAGDRVMLQRREGSAWKVVASERLSASSRFSFRRRLAQPSRFTFRAVLAANAVNLWSHSPPLLLSVSEIHKIKHVVVIMQENRSFDQLLRHVSGRQTGSRWTDGKPTVCVPDPQNRLAGASSRSTITADVNGGGPHARSAMAT